MKKRLMFLEKLFSLSKNRKKIGSTWATGVKEVDRALGTVRLNYKVTQTSGLKPYCIWWIRSFSLKK